MLMIVPTAVDVVMISLLERGVFCLCGIYCLLAYICTSIVIVCPVWLQECRVVPGKNKLRYFRFSVTDPVWTVYADMIISTGFTKL